MIPAVITNPEFYDELPTPVEATTVPPPVSFSEVDRRLAEARVNDLIAKVQRRLR